MAARLTRVECAPHSHLVVCACGFRTLRGTRAAAFAAADEHRAQTHPAASRKALDKRARRTQVVSS